MFTDSIGDVLFNVYYGHRTFVAVSSILAVPTKKHVLCKYRHYCINTAHVVLMC
jgi:hypothetical protein